jgi:hypothetical protein
VCGRRTPRCSIRVGGSAGASPRKLVREADADKAGTGNVSADPDITYGEDPRRGSRPTVPLVRSPGAGMGRSQVTLRYRRPT